jgi:hypothetical protein
MRDYVTECRGVRAGLELDGITPRTMELLRLADLRLLQ